MPESLLTIFHWAIHCAFDSGKKTYQIRNRRLNIGILPSKSMQVHHKSLPHYCHFFYRLGAKDKDRKSPPDHLNTIGRNSWIRNIRISQPLDACLHRYVFWLPIVPSGSGSLLFVGLCVDLSSLCRPVELLRPKNNSDTLLPNFMAVPRALGARILWMIDFEAKARVL